MELTNPLAAEAVRAERARRAAENVQDRGNRNVQEITVRTITEFDTDVGEKEASPLSYASVSR